MGGVLLKNIRKGFVDVGLVDNGYIRILMLIGWVVDMNIGGINEVDNVMSDVF